MAGDEMKVSPIQSDRTPWQRRSVEKPAPERGSHRRIMRQSNAGGQAAKHPTKAAFVMGYAQRHQWPIESHWSLVVTFCDYPKATVGQVGTYGQRSLVVVEQVGVPKWANLLLLTWRACDAGSERALQTQDNAFIRAKEPQRSLAKALRPVAVQKDFATRFQKITSL